MDNFFTKTALYVRFVSELLVANRCDAGEVFAFDGLEHCAATGGDIADLVGIAHLGNGSHGVAATHERVSAISGSLGEIFGNLQGSLCEGIHLEYSHRTVPENGLGAENDLLPVFERSLAGIHAFPSFGD